LADREELMSNAFHLFMTEAPKHAQAWMTAAKSLDEACALDEKTESLAYVAVLAQSLRHWVWTAVSPSM
jgi:hypothetical protein